MDSRTRRRVQDALDIYAGYLIAQHEGGEGWPPLSSEARALAAFRSATDTARANTPHVGWGMVARETRQRPGSQIPRLNGAGLTRAGHRVHRLTLDLEGAGFPTYAKAIRLEALRLPRPAWPTALKLPRRAAVMVRRDATQWLAGQLDKVFPGA